MPQSRKKDHQTLVYNELGTRFDALMNEYDIQRRLEVLIDEFLSGYDLRGKLVLDAGCGPGRATQKLNRAGAQVVALDLGEKLVAYTRDRCPCKPVVGSVLELPFPDDCFDVVLSTEVIEHTASPLDVLTELHRVIKPGGHLLLSTPNWLWQLPVRLASALRLRPYHGLENFVTPAQVRDRFQKLNARIVIQRGIHLIPFQIKLLQPLNVRLDSFGTALLPIMINQAIHVQKTDRGS